MQVGTSSSNLTNLFNPKGWYSGSQYLMKFVLRGRFSVHSHVLSAGGITLLDPGFVWGVAPELDIKPYSPMTSDVFLSLQNE